MQLRAVKPHRLFPIAYAGPRNSCLAVHLSPNELEARDGPRLMQPGSSLPSTVVSADPQVGAEPTLENR